MPLILTALGVPPVWGKTLPGATLCAGTGGTPVPLVGGGFPAEGGM